MWIITYVDKLGRSFRLEHRKEWEHNLSLETVKARANVEYVQVTIDHQTREPEEAGLAVVALGYDYAVIASWRRFSHGWLNLMEKAG